MTSVYEILLWPLVTLLSVIVGIPLRMLNGCKRKRCCSPVEDDLLMIPARDLVRKIVKQEVKCHTVISRYVNRINAVNPLVNAIVEERFEDALKEAAAVDEMITQNKLSEEELLSCYPLLGIPITIKESISVKGMSNGAGSLQAKDKIGEEDADIVKAVKKAGAIVMLVSNTPELCLNWETSNKVTGITCNPYDTRRTCGGSSGGEGALLGAGASLIGLGSDIAGSLRLPAHFCGIFSHKPTARSISLSGHYPDCEDKEKWNDHFIMGPMSRYAVDLPIALKIIIKPEYKEILNLDRKVDLNKLRFFYLDNNASILVNNVDRSIDNSLNSVIDYFRGKYRMDVNKLKFKQSPYLTIVPLLAIEGTDDLYYDQPKSNIYWELLKFIFGQSKATLTGVFYFVLHNLTTKFVSKRKVEKIRVKMFEARKELEDILGDDGVLLYPTYPTPAHYHFMCISKLLDCSYCTVFNAFGLPATNCPIGYSDQGLPVGIQVIAKRNCDRLSLAVAEEIENIFGGWKFSPQSQ